MKILLIEDDENLRDGLIDLFTLDKYQVTAFGLGIEVKELVRKTQPDVCLFDVILPDTNGYQMCRAVRSFSTVPIILLSAHGEEIDKVRGFEAGADDYVTKPFSAIELVHRLKALHRRSTTTAANTYKCHSDSSFTMGDLVVNRSELRAYREKQCIDLSEREMQILELLSLNNNRVIRREDLYESCWGLPYFSNSRALDQYICALRQKIEIDASTPSLIETVRGIGYRYSQI